MKNYYGKFGGCFVPEILIQPLEDLGRHFKLFKYDELSRRIYLNLLNFYVGRPTPVYFAERLTKYIGGAKIFLKREDLTHTGSHKINNALGQAMLAKFMKKKKLIAETGAGQHGVAVATIAAKLGLQAEIYMGKTDIDRQRPNVLKMKLLGANIICASFGKGTLKEAVNMALKAWAKDYEKSYYLLGSALGPSPYPQIVKFFQQIIGKEAKTQIKKQLGKLPDCVVACVGGGSNSIGIFSSFIKYPQIKLVGVEAGGLGINTGKHASRIAFRKVGILHGYKSYIMRDNTGQILPTHSISAGLDYPGIGPEHADLFAKKRVQYVNILDSEAVRAFLLLSKTEGILPALESSHAVAHALKLAKKMGEKQAILVNLSGRGDKDLDSVINYLKTDEKSSKK